jgi:hypothetical protein
LGRILSDFLNRGSDKRTDMIISSRKINLWEVRETAAVLRRTESAVRKLVLRGLIPYRKIGGRLFFIEEEIIEWAQGSPGVKLEDLRKEAGK